MKVALTLVALVALPTCASAPGADRLLQRIESAHEDYELKVFYDASRRFLSHHADHAEADRVAYDFGLQLVTENLASPDSPGAAEARAVLRRLADGGRDEQRRFDAALLMMKFAPEGERVADAQRMLTAFAQSASIDQVYYWLINDAVLKDDVVAAAKYAKALLQRFEHLEGAEDYQRLIRRAEALGRPLNPPGDVSTKLAGKIVLVDFWATWCEPCVAELPRLRAFRKANVNLGFEVLGVSLDEDAAAYSAFIAAQGVDWPVVRVGSTHDSLADRFGVTDLPTYFILDREGRVVATELEGADLYAEISRRIRPSSTPRAPSPSP